MRPRRGPRLVDRLLLASGGAGKPLSSRPRPVSLSGRRGGRAGRRGGEGGRRAPLPILDPLPRRAWWHPPPPSRSPPSSWRPLLPPLHSGGCPRRGRALPCPPPRAPLYPVALFARSYIGSDAQSGSPLSSRTLVVAAPPWTRPPQGPFPPPSPPTPQRGPPPRAVPPRVEQQRPWHRRRWRRGRRPPARGSIPPRRLCCLTSPSRTGRCLPTGASTSWGVEDGLTSLHVAIQNGHMGVGAALQVPTPPRPQMAGRVHPRPWDRIKRPRSDRAGLRSRCAGYGGGCTLLWPETAEAARPSGRRERRRPLEERRAAAARAGVP